jgi:hypothetical protein
MKNHNDTTAAAAFETFRNYRNGEIKVQYHAIEDYVTMAYCNQVIAKKSYNGRRLIRLGEFITPQNMNGAMPYLNSLPGVSVQVKGNQLKPTEAVNWHNDWAGMVQIPAHTELTSNI